MLESRSINMNSKIYDSMQTSNERLAIPISTYVGRQMTGSSVFEIVCNADAQAEAVLALHDRYHTKVLLTAMDLSVEAECFGCEIRAAENEIPTVVGRRAATRADIEALGIPGIGEGRTGVYLEAASRLISHRPEIPVLGSMIGPFSLAGRFFGVSETLELTLADPGLLMELLEKTTEFLLGYAKAYRSVGAAGVVMAEPTAGLLSPRALGRFSSAYIRRIIEACNEENFILILHNCGAKLVHLTAVLESGAEICHFGAPMDIVTALEKVGPDVILAGNLDPVGVFLNSTPAEIEDCVKDLLGRTRTCPNFIISSGCDLPPQTPLENLDAFYAVVNTYS
jgi:uroporphyrinogen decarboxylase